MFLIAYWTNSIINCLLFLIFKKLNYIYLPNLFINNTIYINPNKIEFINSIPMKFHQSSRFIKDFDWDKKIQICLNIKNHIILISDVTIYL